MALRMALDALTGFSNSPSAKQKKCVPTRCLSPCWWRSRRLGELNPGEMSWGRAGKVSGQGVCPPVVGAWPDWVSVPLLVD
jgi:hypothetical protein